MTRRQPSPELGASEALRALARIPNVHGEVFAHLADLEVGDLIRVYSGDKEFAYAIALIMIVPERFQPLKVRLKNAQWIESSQDERLTLVTCWPCASNTHRLIIVATKTLPKPSATTSP